MVVYQTTKVVPGTSAMIATTLKFLVAIHVVFVPPLKIFNMDAIIATPKRQLLAQSIRSCN